MARFLCTGNAAVDILVRPVEEIHWGRTVLVEAIEQHVGGNGANTACALATLGNPVRLLAPVGSGPLAGFITNYLEARGVDVTGLRRTEAATTTTVALVGKDGRRTFLHAPGASAEMSLSPEELAREAQGFTHYHLGAPFRMSRMRPVLAQYLGAMRNAGVTTSIDMQWDPAGRWMQDVAPCLPLTDYFFANEDEYAMLTGMRHPVQAARCLRSQGATVVVLKLGARGCAVSSRQGEFFWPAYDVPVVDTTGAGDCFAAGFLHRVAAGGSLADAARFACAVSALAIQHLGGTQGVRPADQTLAWMRTAPVRE